MTTHDRHPQDAPAKEVVKDASMMKQKEMMAGHYDRLTSAPQTGEKVAATFVPGNLNELIMCFGLVNNLPEVNAIQNGLRRTSGSFVLEAEKIGHSEDVCTYVKSDIGMMAKGNIAPNGKKFPDPDVLLLSYTGCFTFMKWFELLREQYKCETIMLHTPYMGDGKITKNMTEYMVKQLKEEVIPKLERVSGVKFDIDRLARISEEIGEGRGRSRPGAAKRQEQAVADRRLFRRHLLHRADLRRLPRHRRRHRILQVPARGSGGPPRQRPGAGHARRRHGQGEISPGRRRTAELHELPPVLEDVLRRGRGRRRLELHQGRRRLRSRLPPRSRQSAGDARRILPRRLHQPQPADAHRHAVRIISTSTRPTAC